MIGPIAGGLSIGVAPMLAWDHARRSYRRGAPLVDGEQDAFLQAAGIVDEVGALDPSWAPALATAAAATSGMVLVASSGNVVFLSNAFLGGDTLVIARSRAVAEDGVLARMEPVVEVVAAPVVHAWEAIARVLPTQLGDPPREGLPAPVPVPLPGNPAEDLRAVLDWDAAPDELRRSVEAALSPDATLAVAWGNAESGSALWFSRGGEFFRVDAERWDTIARGALAVELTALATRLAQRG